VGVENVGDVAHFLDGLAVDVEVGIDVATLAFDGDPVVEAGAGRIIHAHVPLADEGGLIAGVM
jgi:hypothetical protein